MRARDYRRFCDKEKKKKREQRERQLKPLPAPDYESDYFYVSNTDRFRYRNKRNLVKGRRSLTRQECRAEINEEEQVRNYDK